MDLPSSKQYSERETRGFVRATASWKFPGRQIEVSNRQNQQRGVERGWLPIQRSRWMMAISSCFFVFSPLHHRRFPHLKGGCTVDLELLLPMQCFNSASDEWRAATAISGRPVTGSCYTDGMWSIGLVYSSSGPFCGADWAYHGLIFVPFFCCCCWEKLDLCTVYEGRAGLANTKRATELPLSFNKRTNCLKIIKKNKRTNIRRALFLGESGVLLFGAGSSYLVFFFLRHGSSYLVLGDTQMRSPSFPSAHF